MHRESSGCASGEARGAQVHIGQMHVEVPQVQYIDRIQDVPAVKHVEVTQIHTVQMHVEVPQAQYFYRI